MAAGNKRWTHGCAQLEVHPTFDALRELPPHYLLRELQRTLLQGLARTGKRHFQGLAQAAKAHKSCLDNRVCAKLRLVDDADHLLHHLTPESATEFLNDVMGTIAREDLGSSSHNSWPAPSPPPNGHVGLFAGSPQPSELEELEPDTLQCWWNEGTAGEGDGDELIADIDLHCMTHGATDVSQITGEHVAIIIHEPHDEDLVDNVTETESGAERNVLDLCLTREGTFEHDGPSLADDGETVEQNGDSEEIIATINHMLEPDGTIAEKPKRAAWADVHDNDSDEVAPNAANTDSPPAAAASKQQRRVEKRNRQRKNKLVDSAARPSEFEELECFMHSGTDERSVSSLYVSLLEIELSAKQCGHDIAILGCDCHKPDQLAQYEVMLSSNGVSTICQACSDYY
jgi:hypothetical protein